MTQVNQNILALEERLLALERANSTNATETIDLLNDLAHHICSQDAKRTLQLAQRAKSLALAQKLPYHKGILEGHINIAWGYFFKQNYQPAIEEGLEALGLIKEGDERFAYRIYNVLGSSHLRLSNYAEALKHFNQSYEYAQKLDDRYKEARSLDYIGLIYHNLGQYEKALQSYQRLEQAIKHMELPELQLLRASILNNSAHVYLDMANYHKALEKAEAAISLAQKEGINHLESYALNSRGQALSALNDYTSAQQSFVRSLAISTSRKDQLAQLYSHRGLGLLALKQHAPQEAINYLQKALELAEALDSPAERYSCHEALAKTYKALGDFERALSHFEAFHHSKEVVFNSKTQQHLISLQVTHETERAMQDAEIYRLKTYELERMVGERTRALEATQIEVLERLAIAGERRDSDTGEHTHRVGAIAAGVAGVLGLEAHMIDIIRLAARLHDIGKIGVPDGILLKAARLTPEEYSVMKRHTLIGEQILAQGNSIHIAVAERIAASHHERWNGRGYPYGLVGQEIPIEGRIVAVADVFDALVNARPYKEAWPLEKALLQIEKSAGQHFDPEVVKAFVAFLSYQGINHLNRYFDLSKREFKH
ncbi:MAG: tetratricopeptide repeat protein [Deinococcales bacterium]